MKLFSKIKNAFSKQANQAVSLHAPAVPYHDWNRLFGSLEARLAPLSRDSEGEFLTIGSCLQDFSAKTRKLVEMAESIVRLASGEEVGSAISGLRDQLDRITSYLDFSRKESGVGKQNLQRILEIVDGFDAICNGFSQIATTLQFLSTSTLIESSRLGRSATGFDILSDDVRKLSHLIENKSSSILGNARSLTALVTTAIAETQELLNLQQGSALDMLRNAQASFESLTELSKKSSDVSRQVASRSAEIHRNIGAVITSMQFHDITRQEMEHAGKELERLRERLTAPGQGNGTGTFPQGNAPSASPARNNGEALNGCRQGMVELVGNVSETQSSFLLRVKNEFVNAVGGAIENLQCISINVKDMAAETSKLSAAAHQSGAPLLSQVEEGIKAAIRSLRENVKRSQEIPASVGRAVNGLTEFVKEIEDISVEIKLIAFNAQAKAKRTGRDGDTLGVLAVGIQGLAAEAGSHTAVVLEKLRAIADESKIFHTGSGPSHDLQEVETDGMLSALEGLLTALHGTNREFVNQVSGIAEYGNALGNEIEAMGNQITFHREFDKAMDGIVTELAEIAASSRKLLSPSPQRHKKAPVSKIPAGVTAKHTAPIATTRMRLRTPVPKEQESCKTDSNGSNAGMGDNVELF